MTNRIVENQEIRIKKVNNGYFVEVNTHFKRPDPEGGCFYDHEREEFAFGHGDEDGIIETLTTWLDTTPE